MRFRHALSLVLLLAAGTASAQTTLAEGDLAIISADPADEQFSFVLLTDVEAGTVVRFSDIDLLAGGGTSEDNSGTSNADGVIEVTLSALDAGTVVTVIPGTIPALSDPGQGTATNPNTSFNLSTFGDSIVAYQGGSGTTPVAPGTTYLYYVELADSGSQAPAALGDDAVFNDGDDGFAYDTRPTPTGAGAPTTGTPPELIAAFNDPANYFLSGGADFDPETYLPDAFTVSDGSPTISVSPSSSETSPLPLAENGTRTFTVTLSETPSSDVTVPLTSGDATEATVPTSVVVAASTTSQTFNVAGVADGTVDGDQAVTITTGTATGDATFAGVDPADIFLTVTDVDVNLGTELEAGDLAIIALAPVNSTGSGGRGEEFSFVLLKDVVDGTQINFSDYAVSSNGTITEGGFDGIATVTLSALEAGTVVTVDLTNRELLDSSQGSVVVDDLGQPLILSEFGGDAFFAYQGSTTSPSAGDFIYYTEIRDNGSVPPDALRNDAVFETGNLRGFYYDTQGQTEAPTSGTPDELLAAFGDVDNYVLPQRIVGVDDADRNPLDFVPDAFEILETEGTITVSPLELTIAEAGSADTATFDVTLSRTPAADVTIPLSSGNSAEATVEPTSLTFEAGTLDLTQTVTVTGVNDDVTDGDQVATVAVGEATSRDAGYDSENPADVTVTVTDVLGRDNSVQFADVQQAVLEDAGSVTLEIVVGAEPDAPTDVTVTLTSGDSADLDGFTSATVTIGGADDDRGDDGRYVVTVPITDDVQPEDTETFIFEVSVEDNGADGFTLEAGGQDQTALVVVDNDADAITATVPVDAGAPLLFAVPVGGLRAGDVAERAGVDDVFVLQGDAFVPASPDDLLAFGQAVLLGPDVEGDLSLTGAPGNGNTTYSTGGSGGRVLVTVGNPTGEPVSLDGLEVEGGALSDVALVLDATLGAFRPVSLAGLEDAALGAYSIVVLQVAPDGDEPVSVTLADASSDGPLIGDAPFIPTDGETTVVLELRPQPSNDADGGTQQIGPLATPGDVVAIRVGVGGDGLDAFDGAD
ncbi:hypothetical protein, partial [Rubrivirga sp.]|uniref:hypothetical protein n=1 Tax=Rubrivirga sp. TaxID=1885344 RepID=UPI003C709367